MSGQIIFFDKNLADFSDDSVVATASQSPTLAYLTQNRNNTSAWITSGSVDADNTTFEIDFGSDRDVTEILIVKHNFKSFKIEYWNGSAYVGFATAIDETTNTLTTNRFSRTLVSTQKLQITIRGTMTVDDDKYLYQFIATNLLGQLDGWPVIDEPTHNRNKQTKPMLSGKLNIADNVGGFSFTMRVPNWKSTADLAIIEALYSSNEGFLTWLCGGVTTQFSSSRIGYRLEDIYLMRPANNYMPEWSKGYYQSGLDLKIKLAEVIQ